MKKKNWLFIGLSILIIIVTCYFIFAFVNFKLVSSNNDPLIIKCGVTYESDTRRVSICKGIFYKIIKDEEINNNVKYNLKLWFDKEDINEI